MKVKNLQSAWLAHSVWHACGLVGCSLESVKSEVNTPIRNSKMGPRSMGPSKIQNISPWSYPDAAAAATFAAPAAAVIIHFRRSHRGALHAPV